MNNTIESGEKGEGSGGGGGSAAISPADDIVAPTLAGEEESAQKTDQKVSENPSSVSGQTKKGKNKRKRVVLDSSDEEGDEMEQENSSGGGGAPVAENGALEKPPRSLDFDSDSDSIEYSRLKKSRKSKKKKSKKSKKSKDRREKKKRKKSEKRRKVQEDEILDFDNLSGGGDDDDDDDELSSDGEDMVDDDDAPVYADGVSKSGDSEPENGDDVGESENSAPTASGKAKAGAAEKEKENQPELVEWPSEEKPAEFDAYVIPIEYNVMMKEMFCAVLFYVSPCNLEEMRTNLMMNMATSDNDYSKIEQAWKKYIYDPERDITQQHAHACNNTLGGLWKSFKDEYELSSGLEEQDWGEFEKLMQRSRRDPSSRVSPTRKELRPVRRWLYCIVRGEDAYNMRCTIGAYRLRLRFQSSTIPGVGGGDFKMAASDCKTDALNGNELRPLSSLEMRSLSLRSLCLASSFESQLYEFKDSERYLFLQRISNAKNSKESGVTTNCFSGFPIVACCAARFELLGVSIGDEKTIKFCEPLPKRIDHTNVVPYRSGKAGSGGASAQIEFANRHVGVRANRELYNVAYAARCMITHSFDPSFFKQYVSGAKLTAELSNATSKSTKESVCYQQWASSMDIMSISMACNSGSEYINRVKRLVNDSFTSVTGRKKDKSCLSNALILTAIRRYHELCESCDIEEGHSATVSYINGNGASTSASRVSGYGRASEDRRKLASVSRFLRWFGDAFVVEDPAYVMGVQALGLGLVNRLRDEKPHAMNIAFNKYLKDECVPYVVLFDSVMGNVRHAIRRNLKNVFLEWIRVQRRDKCWKVLGEKLGCTDDAEGDCKLKEMLFDIFNNIINSLGSLQAARQAGERCVPIQLSKNSAVKAAHYASVVNVESSPVRVVLVPNLSLAGAYGDEFSCLLVDVLDYEVERALRTIVLNEAHIMQAYNHNSAADEKPVMKDDNDARIVLLRSDNADMLLSLAQDELRRDFQLYEDTHHLIAVAHDEAQANILRGFLNEVYGTSLAQRSIYTLKDFLAIGPTRVSLLKNGKEGQDEMRWGKLGTQIFVFNTHRFSYDDLMILFSCATGVSGYGPGGALKSLNDTQKREWRRAYISRNQIEPLESDFELFMRRREGLYVKKVRELVENFSEKHLADTDSHWQRGLRTRWILSGVAYQRPKIDLNRGGAPCGNAFEDIYFSKVANNIRVRVREDYMGIANQISLYEKEGRILYLTKQQLATPKLRKDGIISLQVAYMKKNQKNEYEMEKQREREAARKRERNDKRGTQTSIKAYKEFNSTFGGGGGGSGMGHTSLSSQTARVTYPAWCNFSTLQYAPDWCKNVTHLHCVTVAPRNAVDSYSHYARMNHRRFYCEILFIGAENVLNAKQEHGFDSHKAVQGDRQLMQSKRTGLNVAPDICGCGRWFSLEMLARLRSEEGGCIIIPDTRENALRMFLAPNTSRKTCVPWLYKNSDHREDHIVHSDAQFYLDNLNLFEYDEIADRFTNGYAACLQSASVLLWRDDDAEIIRQMNESEEDGDLEELEKSVFSANSPKQDQEDKEEEMRVDEEDDASNKN